MLWKYAKSSSFHPRRKIYFFWLEWWACGTKSSTKHKMTKYTENLTTRHIFSAFYNFHLVFTFLMKFRTQNNVETQNKCLENLISAVMFFVYPHSKWVCFLPRSALFTLKVQFETYPYKCFQGECIQFRNDQYIGLLKTFAENNDHLLSGLRLLDPIWIVEAIRKVIAR